MDEIFSTQRKYPESVQPGIPRLRSLKAGWQRRRIGELLQEISRPIALNDAANYNLVTVKRSRGGVVRRDIKKGKSIAVKSQFVIQAGDFLISKRQIVHGACGIVPVELDDSIVSNEYSVLQCTDLLDSRFLNYLTHTIHFQQTCFHSSIGVHIEKMIFKLEDWFHWKIDVPPVAEQQRIAACLDSVNEKLNALRRKHELLQAYKRGMMQKIFSQELHFKADDGSGFPEWEKITLGDIASVSKGQGVSKDDVVKKGIPCIRYGELYTTYSEVINKIVSFIDAGSSGYVNGQINDILIPASGETALDISTASCLKIANVAIGGDINIIRGDFNGVFLAYYLKNFKRLDIARLAQGISVVHLYGSQLKNLKLEIPQSEEQQKIANFLSAIDAKIDAVAGQIEKMQQFKKGLLQQMFV